MPRKSKRSRRNRSRRQRNRAGRGMPASSSLSLPDLEGLCRFVATVTPERKEESWFDLKSARSEPKADLRLLRGLFKTDFPYRTRMGGFGVLDTTAGGVVNATIGVSSVNSFGQWSSLAALFDEFFVHSMTMDFQPSNAQGGGGFQTVPGVTAGQVTVSTAVSASFITANGLIMASLFSSAGSYGTAAAMVGNATKALHQSNLPWRYIWRNNVAFDPHGITLSSSTTEAWNGWNFVSNSSNIGGSVQIRAANDYLLGDSSHVFHVGTICYTFDLSFRARA